MVYLILFGLFLLHGITLGMDVQVYPVWVTTINQRLLYDSFVGDSYGGMRIRQALQLGANPNYVDPCFELGTPLNAAVLNTQLRTIELLLAHGADPNLESANGVTPLAYELDAYGPPFPFGHDIAGQRQVIGTLARLIAAGARVNHPSVQLRLQERPELAIVLKQAQEIAKEAGSQKLR